MKNVNFGQSTSELHGGDVLENNDASQEDVPQFGAVDIVEAFTAMRHEWRGQTKESRALAEQIQAAVTSFQSLESKLLANVADVRGAADAKLLVQLIVETDHQLSRAISAIARWDSNQQRAAEETKAVQHYFEGMNFLARWLARPLMTFIAEQRSMQDSTAANPTLEGLNLVLARLRRGMAEQAIERLDVLGQAFDASTMHAIGTIASTDYPSGHVAEQLSAAYLWQGHLFRFADVRLAQ